MAIGWAGQSRRCEGGRIAIYPNGSQAVFRIDNNGGPFYLSAPDASCTLSILHESRSYTVVVVATYKIWRPLLAGW